MQDVYRALSGAGSREAHVKYYYSIVAVVRTGSQRKSGREAHLKKVACVAVPALLYEYLLAGAVVAVEPR